MSKSWTIWYKDKTGEDWTKQNSGKKLEALASKLNEKERKIMELLYKNYTEQLQTFDSATAKLKTAENEALEQNKEKEKKQKLAIQATAESLRAQGNNRANAQEKTVNNIKDAYEATVKSTQNKMENYKQAVADSVNQKVNEAKNNLEKEYRDVEHKYLQKYKTEFNRTINEIKGILKEYKVENKDEYKKVGKLKAKELIEERKEELGNKYEEALSYLDGIKEYKPEPNTTPTIEVKTAYETITISKVEEDMLDVVGYQKGAGFVVTYGDNFKVTFKKKVYRIEGGNNVDEEMKVLLTTLAKKSDVELKAGSVIYFRGALYIYCALDNWRIAHDIGKSNEDDGLNSLLKALQKEEINKSK